MADNAFDRVELARAEVDGDPIGPGWLEHAATSSAAVHTTTSDDLTPYMEYPADDVPIVLL